MYIYFNPKHYLMVVSIASLLFGVLVFVFPAILNYLVGGFFLFVGVTGLLSALSQQ